MGASPRTLRTSRNASTREYGCEDGNRQKTHGRPVDESSHQNFACVPGYERGGDGAGIQRLDLSKNQAEDLITEVFAGHGKSFSRGPFNHMDFRT